MPLKFITLFFFAVAVTGCHLAKVSQSQKFRVGLALGHGGVDDKSFNASAFEGAKRAEKELGIELRYYEVSEDSLMEPVLKSFAHKKFDLIIVVEYSAEDALKKAAAAYPKSHFAIIDAVVGMPNVEALTFKENEGSFLAGALAAMKSKTGVVGFIGGMDIPLIRRFELGYREGAKHIRPDITVVSNYVGVTGDAWNDPTKGKELSLIQMSKGADVIFHAAGQSGMGVFDAVEERTRESKTHQKFFAIGVDSNQNGLKPGYVLTSMLKRVDVAVFEAIKAAKAEHFKGGQTEFGLKDSGIALAMDQYNRELVTDEMLRVLSRLKSKIIESKIKVSDYYKVAH